MNLLNAKTMEMQIAGNNSQQSTETTFKDRYLQKNSNSENKTIIDQPEKNTLIKKPITGYVIGQKPSKIIDGRLHLHQRTKLDYQNTEEKYLIFEELIPYLKQELEISQTKALQALIVATEFTPYLRKIDTDTMEAVSDNPSQLQQALMLELTNRISQSFKLIELSELIIQENSIGKLKNNLLNNVDEIVIANKKFTKAQLGDEVFREIKDRLGALQNSANTPDKTVKIFTDLTARKRISICHWQSVCSQILAFQTTSVRKQFASLLTINYAEDTSLIPASAQECQNISNLIPKLSLVVHPAFTIMRPLFVWLSEHHLQPIETDTTSMEVSSEENQPLLETLTSKKLALLRSKAMEMLYTHIPPLESTGLENLSIVKHLLIDIEQLDDPIKNIKEAIKEISTEDLSSVVELFSKLLCDLTPDVTLKHRLAVIYTLLKFTDQNLIEQLLMTDSIGEDTLSEMYKTLLILTYSLYENTDEEDKAEKQIKVNCLLKTLMLRMAINIVLIAQENKAKVTLKILDRANRLIAHHNEVIQKFGPQEEDENNAYDDCCSDYGDDDDMQQDNRISNEDYLALPDCILNSSNKLIESSADINSSVVTIDPEQLILPMDKHFRLDSTTRTNNLPSSCRATGKRYLRTTKDNKKLIHDFVIAPRNKDLANLSQYRDLDIPIGCLFPEEKSICYQHPAVIQQLTEMCDALTEDVNLNIIKDLLILASKDTEKLIDFSEEIVKIISMCGNKVICDFLSRLVLIVNNIPTKRSQAQLLEYTATLLFLKINAGSIKINNLIKFLYVIRSRTDKLNFAGRSFGKFGNTESNKLKSYLDQLFFNRKFNLPDGMQGLRIRNTLINAIKLSASEGYEAIFDNFLEKIRSQYLQKDNYKTTITNYITIVEEFLEIGIHIDKSGLEQKKLRRDEATEGNVSYKVKWLKNNVVELYDLLLATTNNDESPDLMDIDTDLVSTEWHSSMQPTATMLVDDTSVSVYLHRQIDDLLSNIRLFANSIALDNLLSEDDISIFGSIVDKINDYTKIPLTEQITLLEQQDPLIVIEHVIKTRQLLNDLNICISNYRIYKDIAITTNDLENAKKTLYNLYSISSLPDPESLQQQINYITNPIINDLTAEDKAKLSSIQPLIDTHHHYKPLLFALDHPDIHQFSRNPQLISDRTNKALEQCDDHSKDLYNEYTSLGKTLTYLKIKPIITNASLVESKRLHDIKNGHAKQIEYLSKQQLECQSHKIMETMDETATPRLSNVLQQMKFSHSYQRLDFDKEPLTHNQKSQLLHIAQGTISGAVKPKNTSLFDLIGRETTQKNKSQSVTSVPYNKKEIDELITNRDKVIENIQKSHSISLTSFASKLDTLQKQKDEAINNHNAETKELVQVNKNIDELLGSNKTAMIQIDNELHPYLVALIVLNYHYSCYKVGLISDDHCKVYAKLSNVIRANTQKQDKTIDKNNWLYLVNKCQSLNIDPNILPEIVKLEELEKITSSQENIEVNIAELKRNIEYYQQLEVENKAKISESVKKLELELQPELKAQEEKTVEAQTSLFTQAFEQGKQLSLHKLIQRKLCNHIQQHGSDVAIDISTKEAYEELKLHVPQTYKDEINLPYHLLYSNPKLAGSFVVFSIINVKGAYPLLQSLHAEDKLHPYQFLESDEAGNLCSALVLAAATGKYHACEAILDIQSKSADMGIDFNHKLLTASPSTDNRNLLHHLANLAKPHTMDIALQFITDISKKQEYDSDFPVDCLENQVAMNKNYILTELISHKDCENKLPGDILLYRIGEYIKQCHQDNMGDLFNFCKQHLINNFKAMWQASAKVLDAQQLFNMLEYFMKGVGDFDDLESDKKEVARYFIHEFLRIIKVNSTVDVYNKLLDNINIQSSRKRKLLV
jgi:hypothetical protein